jgi:hypothetical protein
MGKRGFSSRARVDLQSITTHSIFAGVVEGALAPLSVLGLGDAVGAVVKF